jgi:hypothetical protein
MKFCNLEMYYKEFKAIFTDCHVRVTNIKDDVHIGFSSIVQEFKKNC